MRISGTSAVATGFVFLMGCGSTASSREPTDGRETKPIAPNTEQLAVIAVDAATGNGLPTYLHTFDRSLMSVGLSPTEVSEGGYDKHIGSYGTHAINSSNGYELGISNAGSPLLGQAPYGTAAAHNDRVKGYFVNAGLPEGEIVSVDVHVRSTVGGRVGQAPSSLAPPVYTSVLARGVHGIPISESFAWAQINANDSVVGESVYWPQIPQSVIDEAQALQTALSEPSALTVYRAGLPSGSGRVVIRHSSATATGAFEAYAVFDIATKAGADETVTRHFDSSGNEVHLPQERRRLTSSPKR